MSKDFSTNNFIVNIKSILTIKSFWILNFVLIALISVVFRWAEYNSNINDSKKISSLLRDEYLSANSYLLSKKLTDFEKIKLIKCVKLDEISSTSRSYYDTVTANSNCSQFDFFRFKMDFLSVNGLKYELSFERPRSLRDIFFEFFVYLFIFLGIYNFFNYIKSEKEKSDNRIQMLAIEKEFLQNKTSQAKHDLASPMTAINMLANINGFDEKYQNLLKLCMERIEGIFKDLNSENIRDDESILETFEIVSSVNEIINEKKISNDSVIINFELVDNLSISVSGVKSEFARVLSNVINNSIDAIANIANGTITCSFELSKRFATLTVEDNGKGIAPGHIKKVWQKGFTQGKQGTGLGLFHAKQTIESWGGEVDVESAQGVGTKISMSFIRADLLF